MLRLAFHASLACFSNPSLFYLRLPQISKLSSIAFFNLFKHNRTKTAGGINGSMTEVLEILGPFDHIFPTSDASFYVSLLRKCIKTKNFFMGGLVHSHLTKYGLDAELLVSNVLLDMYAKVGCLDSSIKLFDEMAERDVISWCTLISGYISHGLDLYAYELFKRMCASGFRPNHFIISSVLKGCSSCGVLELGLPVHGLVIKSGLGFDRFVEIGLVGMYAKCGLLEDARKTFYEIPVKSSIAWNMMVSGYVQNGCFIEAAKVCWEMCQIGLVMDLVTLRILASMASAMEMLEFCKNIHVYSIKVGLDADSFVVAELVKLLTKLGDVAYMEKLFETVRKPDASLYSLLISGYHLHGNRVEAVKLAKELLNVDINPCQGALVSVLNLCLCKAEGTQVHGCIIKMGYVFYVSIGNALISLYSKFGEMEDANLTFLGMPMRDVVTWTAIMAGLVQNLQFGEALGLFRAFRDTGTQLDQHSIVTIINACTGLRAIKEGKQLHALSFKLGVEISDFTKVSLLHMYAKCGYIDCATRLFSYSSIPHDLITTNVMLAGYCWNLQPEKALKLFDQEYRSGLVPDEFSLTTVLGACADIRSVVMGEQVHCLIAKSGFEFSDLIIGNAIISFYLKSGSIASACKFFYSIKRWNSSTYATLMLGYLQKGGKSEDLQLFYQMQQIGLHANPVGFARILKGCIDLAAINLGKQIHTCIIKMGLVSDADIGNALIGMHECGDMHKMREMFGEITMREDGLNKPMADQDFQDAGKVSTFKVIELSKSEKELQNYCSYLDVLGISSTIAVSEMKETSILAHMIQSDLELDVSVGNSVISGCRDSRISENKCNVLGKVLAREIVLWNYMASNMPRTAVG